jgi:hypothetical protein
MPTQPLDDRQISVEEYLSTGYEPDCEYDDGVVQERSLGEFEHSFLQALLTTIFTNNMEGWGVFWPPGAARPDCRAQVSGARRVCAARRIAL